MNKSNEQQAPRFWRDEEFMNAVGSLSEEVHDLLDGPDGDGQLYGGYETQRVVLELPKAYVLLAGFLASVDEKQEQPLSFFEYARSTPGDKRAQSRLGQLRNAYLERNLQQSLALDLHLMATGALELRGRRGL